jgi:hypothetical protein
MDIPGYNKWLIEWYRMLKIMCISGVHIQVPHVMIVKQ